MITRKRKILYFLIVPAIIFLLLIAIFFIIINRIGGDDYTGEFARLLPPETSALATLENLETVWNQASSMQPFINAANSNVIREKLLSDDQEEDSDKNSARERLEKRFRFGKDIIMRWMGREVCVAFVPSPDSAEPPGLILMSRTELGFEERMAEFFAIHYPELNLETTHYKNSAIRCYKGEEKRDSLCFMRFGKTVFISFRTENPWILKKIIDCQTDRDLPSLFDQEDFREYNEEKPKEGLSIFISPEIFLTGLKHSGDISDSKNIEESLPFLNGLLAGFRYIMVNLTLEDNLKGQVHFYRKQPETNDPLIKDEFRVVSLADDDIDGLLAFRGAPDSVSEDIRKILDFLIMEENEEEDVEENILLNTIRDKMLVHINGEVSLVLNRILPGLLFPVPQMNLFMEVSGPEASENLAKTFGLKATFSGEPGEIMTPLGPLTAKKRLLDSMEFLELSLGVPRKNITEDSNTLRKNEMFAAFKKRDSKRTDLLLLLDFRKIHQDLAEMQPLPRFWKEKTREKVAKAGDWFEVLSHFKGFLLWRLDEPEVIRYNFSFPFEENN